ncbi:carboxymuconolactone decarboxylase family protein [Terracidiphilus gabretensis]|uniref:carboxymuconolactone decarboxylase family protein n=1 Tax=Terracidiphilus gabretensis TaxID=1577687 RepID=UPI0009E6BD17|nr:carboxymuconolactone decarboxylase family protein [Terracidiphilus gabretensis]
MHRQATDQFALIRAMEPNMYRPNPLPSQITIPLPSDEEAGRIIGDSYDPKMTLNVIKMMAGTEDMYPPTVAFIKAMFQAEGIDPRTREMIMLRAAKVLNSPYEWQANVVLGKNAGLTDEEIEAAACDGPVTGINLDYVLVCKAADELSCTATLTDDTLSELLNRYDEVVCRKFILIISWFNLLSRFLNGCRVPLETADKIGDSTSPLR